MSVRLRLTLMYAGVLVVCGALLLAASYGLVARSIDSEPSAPPAVLAPEVGGGPVTSESQLQIRRQVREEIENDTLSDLRLYYLLALTAMAMGAVALGWLLAGRALRPVHAIAATARDVSRDSLDRRVGLDGPEDELKDLADTIDTMLGRLDDAFANQQRFVANASHELRTPLTVIVGFLEIALADPGLDEKTRTAHLNLMTEQAQRMQRLIEDMLTLSRLESDEYPLKRERVDVRALVEQVAIDARALSNGRHEIDFAVDGPDVMGSAEELRSAFGNLASNAVRYTPEGGKIELRWLRGPNDLRFEVIDNGIGIDEQHISRLTERFYRVDKSRSRETQGTGLGLAIVKHVLLRHGGKLAIRSVPGKGSVFTATLPNTSLPG
jgi:signal transduction histidine kinase